MAQTQIRRGRTQVFVVEETTQDTFEDPGNGDVFLASNVSYADESSMWTPNYVRNDFLSMDEVPGSAMATLSFSVPLKGSGSAGVAPEFGEALKACGFAETIVASTSVTYSPLSTYDGSGGNPGPSYSFGMIVDGQRYAAKGGFGTLTMSGGENGEPFMLSFTFRGAHVTKAADTMLSPTYDTTKPPAFLGGSLSVDFGSSYTPKGITGFEVDLGNTVRMGRDFNESTGYYGSRITGRQTTGQLSCENVAVATHDWDGIQKAGTSGTLATGPVGATAGNRYAINLGRIILRPITAEDSEGVDSLSIPFSVSSAENDAEGTNLDLSIVLT